MQTILTHLITKINESTPKTNPFNHCFINNIFPTQFYKQLLSEIPLHLFKGSITKTQLEIQSLDLLKNLPFWQEFIKILCSEEFKQTIINKFAVPNGFPHVKLYIMKKNYELGPHIDMEEKLFTSLFYLPTVEMQGLGTVFCRRNDKPLVPFEWDCFEILDRMPFLPNTFVCFYGKNSYHGVEKINTERITMQYLIRKTKLPGLYYP